MPSDGYFCLSDIRVFGHAEGNKPDMVKGFKATRDFRKDARNMMLTWKKANNAYGYLIRYGTATSKLYNSILVYGDTQYDMRGLDKDTRYYFSIQAIGETGCSAPTKCIKQ